MKTIKELEVEEHNHKFTYPESYMTHEKFKVRKERIQTLKDVLKLIKGCAGKTLILREELINKIQGTSGKEVKNNGK